ncbi:MAG: hypothetical protein HFH80_00560 [Lachnospiraceae bacterium]|nr:hypothetical protein [Lachnospiraceae bacterium]
MFGFKRKTGEIDAQLTIVANSLANNYKDAARDGLKEARRLFEALESELSERERTRISQQIDSFQEQMQGYSHYNHIGW